MAYAENYLTEKGTQLCAKLLVGDTLKITRVVGANGVQQGIEYKDYTDVGPPVILFATNQGVVYDPSVDKNRLMLPAYWSNESFYVSSQITEIGVFAEDPDEGEILLSVFPFYESPMALLAETQGPLEITAVLFVKLSLANTIEIEVPSSVVYLTRPEAEALFWVIGHKYPATEILESNGYDSEYWQRWQDEQIELLKIKVDEGAAKAVTVVLNPLPETTWVLIQGYIDRASGNMMA